MSRESIQAKARRYLAEGRVVVTGVLGDQVTAVCQGETGAYDLGHAQGRGWWCTCPVRTDNCSHLAALWLITIRKPNAGAPLAVHQRGTKGHLHEGVNHDLH
jgi:uncharacterized Zn finger protein